MVNRIQGVISILALVTAAGLVFSPTSAAAVGEGEEGQCDVRSTFAFDEELCCTCVGIGPEEWDGSKFCHAAQTGQGGVYHCDDSYCPFLAHPCGLT